MKLFTDLGLDPIGLMLGFGEMAFHRFETDAGVGGLLKLSGGRLDILAIHSDNQGRGHVRDFISACQKEYAVICFWHVDNVSLKAALLRYNFKPEMEIQGDGEAVDGLRWDKQQTKGTQV